MDGDDYASAATFRPFELGEIGKRATKQPVALRRSNCRCKYLADAAVIGFQERLYVHINYMK
jgi:hypothetical protein